MGRAAVEAMAAGRPVVGTRVSGIQDVIIHEVSGLLVPPADPREIAKAVVRVLNDPAAAGRLVENARTSLHGFGVDAMLDDIEALYARLVEGRHLCYPI
jgi:glycosyltransferase involved in cell wall biosynthesis